MPNCLGCGGACCEGISLNVRFDNSDLQRFMELHSLPIIQPDATHRYFDSPCTALIEGRCGIYPNRPKVCRDFVPGGKECLGTVRARRTPEQYDTFRGDDDPTVEALYGKGASPWP